MAKGESGFSKTGGLSSATPEQQRLMNGLKRRNAEYDEYSEPKFTKNKDGTISYEYVKTKIVHKVHGGKMQSYEKNDVYRRVEVITGKIMKDGLRRENKPVKTETLIKKGKR